MAILHETKQLVLFTGMVIFLATQLQLCMAPMYITAFSYASLYKIGWRIFGTGLDLFGFEHGWTGADHPLRHFNVPSLSEVVTYIWSTVCFGEFLLLVCAYFTAYFG